MKKYVISLLFLIVQNMCAMELEQLSFQDDAKALWFAKLFNKYPNGYGENKKQIDKCKEAMNYFLNKSENSNICLEEMYFRESRKDSGNKEYIDTQNHKKQFFRQFEPLSARVKQYQVMLNNIEAVELLDGMHEPLSCNITSREYNIKTRIFAMALYEAAEQYYATSNAMKFVILEPYLAFAGYYSGVVDLCSPGFLAELYEDGKPTICFSDDGFKGTFHYVEPSFLKAYSHPGHTGNTLRLKKPNGKPFASELIAFVSQDVKKARVDAFTTLFRGWVEYLASEKDRERYMSAFIELLKRLNWHDITLSSAKDCEKVLEREDALQNIGSWS